MYENVPPKLRRFCRAVSRRLNLPREVRARVMSDFTTSLAARLESGESEDAILASLGTPKQTALELSAQMSELAYRKSPWRWLFLALCVLSGAYLAFLGAVNSFFTAFLRPGSSVGIIGGADGPTAIFVTSAQRSGVDWDVVILLVVFVLSLVSFFLLRKCKKK